MQRFYPFLNDHQSVDIGHLTLENQGDQVNLFGNLTFTIDKQSLQEAKALHLVLQEVITFLQQHHADQFDRTQTINKQSQHIHQIDNPFL